MPKIYSVESKKENSSGSGMKKVEVHLDPKLVALILVILAMIFFGKQLLSVVLFMMLAFVFMCTMRPIVRWFEKKGVSKGWALFLSYAGLVLACVILIAIIVVPFINQMDSLVATLPKWIGEMIDWLKGINIGGKGLDTAEIEKAATGWLKDLTNLGNVKSVTSAVSGMFSGFATFFSAVVLSVYLVAEHDSLSDVLFIRIRSKEKKDMVKQLIVDVEDKIGNWVLGQGAVSLFATIFSAVILSIFRVPFAVPLAVLVGILDAVPTVGATLAGIIVGIISLITIGPIKAIIILVLMMLYQQVENNIIIPKVMSNVSGLKPLYILVGAIIMLIIAGPIGAIVTVPLLVIAKIAYEFYVDLQKLEAKGIV